LCGRDKLFFSIEEWHSSRETRVFSCV
jgi:hypothetical protein